MTERVTLDHDWFPLAVPGNVEIGERSWLHSSYAFIHYRSDRPAGLVVGKDTGIYVETFFDIGPDGHVQIGSYTTLAGPIVSTNARVEIGSYVMISREVVIAEDWCATPDWQSPARTRTRDIVIGDAAWIGARATLLGGARIGEGSIVGAGAVIDFETPPFAVVAGNPARIVGWSRPAGQPGREIAEPA